MAKGGGSTRTISANNASGSRTSSSVLTKSTNINAYDLAKKIVANYGYNTREEQRALTSFISMISGDKTYDKISDMAIKISQNSVVDNTLKKINVTINPNDLANKMITSYQYSTNEEHKEFVGAMRQVVGDKMYNIITNIANKIAEKNKVKKL